MASYDEYLVGWICALPVEVAAAKATLDRIHDAPRDELTDDDDNNYILGSLHGHNVVLAHPKHGTYGQIPVVDVVTQLNARFKHIRFYLMVGIAGGVPGTKEDVRLGDVVVSKATAGWAGVVQCDVDGERAADQSTHGRALDPSTQLLVTATGKTETATIFDDSQMCEYVSEIIQKDPITYAHPGPEQDILFEPDYNHTTIDSEDNGCTRCNPERIRPRQPRESQDPIVHYGLIASSPHLICHGLIRDQLAQKHGVLCLETEATGLKDAAQYLIIRGICDYADSHISNIWHAYASLTAAAYAKEVLSFVPTVPTTNSIALNTHAEAAPVLDALLLTRPEVDRKTLIALKGRRVDGTCEWLTRHSTYQEWLADDDLPLLWISGGPGKGKTMLAVYVTEVLQPVVDAAQDLLLYYFCSSRDKSRNTAQTILRGIIHQWIDLRPHLAQHIKSSFDGTETTRSTVSSFVPLWKVFLTLLRQARTSRVICVLDGLDECEKTSLAQFSDALVHHLTDSEQRRRPRLKLILLSRPEPAIVESKLGQYQQIRLDDPDTTQISHDVKRYIFAKVAELASEQNLSEEMVTQVQQTLLDGAEGTFLWVGFVVNELQGRAWGKMNSILLRVPKGLVGVYQRLLQQIEDKEALVPILQWIVFAARPLTVEELTTATGIEASGTIPATEVIRNRLKFCGLLVKIDRGVVNLVHESAKEFFQSDQVNAPGIRMFRMSQLTHRTLMRTCLNHVERGYGDVGRIVFDPLLDYASQYWPVHFHHASDVLDARLEFQRPFFSIVSALREEWWKFYWAHEKNGGNPPSFTLLHLAAYLGNIAWAKILIDEHARLILKKDNYGRTPLFWAVNRGHQDMVELLIDHGAQVNAKDRSELTALHIAVTAQHKDIVLELLDRGAHLESRTEHGDTALVRAIQANSSEIIRILLSHGARVDILPIPPGVASLKGPTEPLEERVKELLGLQEEIFLARYQKASRKVNMVMKGLGLTFHIPVVTRLMTLYLKFLTSDRWEHFSVLQELVREKRTDELRQWAESYREFFVHLVRARNSKRLLAMSDLPTQIFATCAPGDLQALLVVSVLAGSEAKLAAVRDRWREGDLITARAFARWAAIACNRDAVEFLHYGVREFFNDFDACIQCGNRADNVSRSVVLLTLHFAMLENKKPQPIDYLSRAIAGFYEGYIGGVHEVGLFGDVNQACAIELIDISEGQDFTRLHLFLTSILQFAQHCQEKGQDRFFDILSASCLILCQDDATAHQWLIAEAMPETMSALISKQSYGPLQQRACRALVECLIIGKQYGLTLTAPAPRKRMSLYLHSLPRVDNMITQITGL